MGGARRHPAPLRGEVSRLALWTGIFAAPLAWGVQLIAAYALVAHTCYPEAVPHHVPTLGATRTLGLLVSALALAGAAAGGLVALRSWRATRDEGEHAGGHLLHHAEGRTRFMAAAGLIVSAIFGGGVLFAAAPLLVLRVCQW